MNNLKKLTILLIVLSQINSIKKLKEICKEEDDFDIKRSFHKIQSKFDLDFPQSKIFSDGGYYKNFLYYPENGESYEITLKEFVINQNDYKKQKKKIAKEILLVQEFSEYDSDRLMKYIGCFFRRDEKQKITKVFLMREKLDDLLTKMSIFEKLSEIQRIEHYKKLIQDLQIFHLTNNKKKKTSYIHLGINLRNIMSKGEITPENNFKLKFTNYGTMKKNGKEIKEASPNIILAYMQPSLKDANSKKKKVAIKPQMDIYSLFITIAQLEYGKDILAHSNIKFGGHENSFDFLNGREYRDDIKITAYDNDFHNAFLNNLFLAYSKKKNPESELNDLSIFEGLKNEAYNKETECDSLFCVILRELRMEVSDIDDTLTASIRMKRIYDSLNNLII